MNTFPETHSENRPKNHRESDAFGENKNKTTGRKSFRPLILFVLTWTVAVPALSLALLVAVQTLFLLAASERFSAAARFGAREAASQNATRASVLAAVDRGFSSERMRNSLCAIEVHRQRPQPGDTVSVSLLYNPSVAVPDLVGWLGMRLDNRALVIRHVE